MPYDLCHYASLGVYKPHSVLHVLRPRCQKLAFLYKRALFYNGASAKYFNFGYKTVLTCHEIAGRVSRWGFDFRHFKLSYLNRSNRATDVYGYPRELIVAQKIFVVKKVKIN